MPALPFALPFGMTLPSEVRPLDQAELAILIPVFGDSLDYNAIRVSDALGGGGRPYTVWLPGRGTVLSLGPAAFADPGADPALLVHEATHSWQSQHYPVPGAYMANSLASQAAAAAAGGSAYRYRPGRPFGSYAAEQIAKQVEHGLPEIVAHVRSAGPGRWDAGNLRSLSIPRWELAAPSVADQSTRSDHE